MNNQQRLKKYPFNVAHKVQLVSILKNVNPTNEGSDISIYKTPINKDTLCTSKTKSVITLNRNQIDKLTDLLFNIGLNGNSYTFGTSTAIGLDGLILFVDSKNKIVEYIKICFDCGEVELKTSRVQKSIGLPCDEKMILLKALFNEAKVHFNE